MKQFRLFLEKLCKAITEYYGEDCRADVSEIQKNNGIVYYGVTIMNRNSNISPTIYMEEMYQEYLEGKPIGEIMEQVIRIYERNRIEGKIDVQFFMDFSEVRERVVYKLINYKSNRELLSDVPHIPFLDMALVCYYSILHDTLGSATILIRKGMLHKWKVSEKELFDIAAANTPRILTAQIRAMDQIMEEAAQTVCLAAGEKISLPAGESCMYVLTNNRKMFGAVCILYPEVLQLFAEKMEENLYILPSSVHEVILIPERQEICKDEFKEIVKDVNLTQVAPEEMLSDCVYYYDREEKEIRML